MSVGGVGDLDARDLCRGDEFGCQIGPRRATMDDFLQRSTWTSTKMEAYVSHF